MTRDIEAITELLGPLDPAANHYPHENSARRMLLERIGTVTSDDLLDDAELTVPTVFDPWRPHSARGKSGRPRSRSRTVLSVVAVAACVVAVVLGALTLTRIRNDSPATPPTPPQTAGPGLNSVLPVAWPMAAPASGSDQTPTAVADDFARRALGLTKFSVVLASKTQPDLDRATLGLPNGTTLRLVLGRYDAKWYVQSVGAAARLTHVGPRTSIAIDAPSGTAQVQLWYRTVTGLITAPSYSRSVAVSAGRHSLGLPETGVFAALAVYRSAAGTPLGAQCFFNIGVAPGVLVTK